MAKLTLPFYAVQSNQAPNIPDLILDPNQEFFEAKRASFSRLKTGMYAFGRIKTGRRNR
jgi:hypothetical protein